MDESLVNTLAEWGITFRRRELLEQALRHASYCNQVPDRPASNERLEFLGDVVISLAVADWLFSRCPDSREGALTKLRAAAVNRTALARAARELNLGAHLLLGRSEKANRGHALPSLLASAFEALVGAIYLDQGLAQAATFTLGQLAPVLAQHVERAEDPEDAKSLLQMWAQEHARALPVYEIVVEIGPPHRRQFTAQVRVNGRMLGRGSGRSKRAAEQAAAEASLARLHAPAAWGGSPLLYEAAW